MADSTCEIMSRLAPGADVCDPTIQSCPTTVTSTSATNASLPPHYDEENQVCSIERADHFSSEEGPKAPRWHPQGIEKLFCSRETQETNQTPVTKITFTEEEVEPIVAKAAPKTRRGKRHQDAAKREDKNHRHPVEANSQVGKALEHRGGSEKRHAVAERESHNSHGDDGEKGAQAPRREERVLGLGPASSNSPQGKIPVSVGYVPEAASPAVGRPYYDNFHGERNKVELVKISGVGGEAASSHVEEPSIQIASTGEPPSLGTNVAEKHGRHPPREGKAPLGFANPAGNTDLSGDGQPKSIASVAKFDQGMSPAEFPTVADMPHKVDEDPRNFSRGAHSFENDATGRTSSLFGIFSFLQIPAERSRIFPDEPLAWVFTAPLIFAPRFLSMAVAEPSDALKDSRQVLSKLGSDHLKDSSHHGHSRDQERHNQEESQEEAHA